MKQRARKDVLPVLIGELKLAVLEEKDAAAVAEYHQLGCEVMERRTEVEQAKTDFENAKKLLEEAQFGDAQAESARSRNTFKRENLGKQIQALRAKIEGHVQAASG